MSLNAKFIARRTAWAAVDNWSQQVAQIVTFVIIGNIVGPTVYGVMALGFIYSRIINSCIRETFGEAVIQRRQAERGHFEAAFWVVFGLGVAAALFSWIVAPFVAQAFGEPELVIVIRMLGLTFPVVATANILQSRLRRELNFKALAFRSIIAHGGASAFAITLVLNGFGIWSLIGFQLCVPTLDFLCLAIQGRWLPRPKFSLSHYREIAGFSYKTMASQFIGTAGHQVNNLMIGFFVGTTSLGLYGMSRRLFGAVQRALVGVINSVALPTFSKLQDDLPQLCRALTEATRFASMIAFPAFAGLALISSWLIDVLLKEEWRPIASIVPILCVIGFQIPATLFLTTAKRAVGRAGLILKIATLTVVLRAILGGTAIALGYGILGVAFATMAMVYILMPLRLILAKRILGLEVLAFCKCMVPATKATLFMAACVHGTDLLLGGRVPAVMVLVAMIAVGAVSYMAALFVIARPALNQLIAMVRR